MSIASLFVALAYPRKVVADKKKSGNEKLQQEKSAHYPEPTPQAAVFAGDGAWAEPAPSPVVKTHPRLSR